MKVSFSDQELRLRVQHDELRRLLSGETVSTAVVAPGFNWTVALRTADAFSFVARNGCAECQLPAAALQGLANTSPSREGLRFEVPGQGAAALGVSFDVDIRSGPSRRPER